MERVALKSQAVASAGYDPERRELEVEFTSGRIYRYAEVPEGVFEWLLRTPSKGSFVQRMIDGRYAYREVSDTTDPPPDALLSQLLASLAEPDDDRGPLDD